MHAYIVLKQGRDDSALSPLRAYIYITRVHPQPKRLYAFALASPSSTPYYYQVYIYMYLCILRSLYMYTNTFLRAQLDLNVFLPARVSLFW